MILKRLLLFLILSVGADVPAATFEFLISPASDYRGEVSAISADGSTVVGYRMRADYTEQRGFRWTKAGGFQNIPLPSGGTYCWPSAVSEDGAVVVGQASTPQGNFAFRSAGESTAALGALNGTVQSWAVGVSADGSTISGFSDANNQGGLLAYRWTASTGMTSLSAPQQISGQAYGISADGRTITGSYWDSTHYPVPVFWRDSSLTFLPAPEHFFGTASLTNSDGSIIVGSGKISDEVGTTGQFVLRWKVGNPKPDVFGNLRAYGRDSIDYFPKGMSDDGNRIVGSAVGIDLPYPPEAFVWTPENGSQRLQAVLAQYYGIDLSRYILTGATGISADGQTIVGNCWLASDPYRQSYSWIARGLKDIPKLQPPGPTPAPAPGKKPELTLEGKPYRVSRVAKTRISGAARYAQQVTYKVGNGKWKDTRGIRQWSFTPKLKRGLNKITIRGIGRSPETVSTNLVYIFFSPSQ